jgi:hypothetical protein
MENKNLLTLAIIALTISATGLTYGYAVWSLSHTTTGHVTVTTTPSGDFEVPTSITFPDTTPGGTATVTVVVTSTLDKTVTLNAVGGAGNVTVTSDTVTLPAEGTAILTLTIHASDEADGGYTIPIQFTVTE